MGVEQTRADYDDEDDVGHTVPVSLLNTCRELSSENRFSKPISLTEKVLFGEQHLFYVDLVSNQLIL